MKKEKSTNIFIRDVYINREYSQILFNQRVLEEAENEQNPLLERCKFLAIVKSNMDEFFMVRIGALFNENYANPNNRENKTNLTASEQIDGIYKIAAEFSERVTVAGKNIFAALKNEGLIFENLREKKEKSSAHKTTQKKSDLNPTLETYFKTTLLPLLNPIVLSSKHPLIHLENLKLYIFLQLEKGGKKFFGILPVPNQYDRIIDFNKGKNTHLVATEDLVYQFADSIFKKYKVLNKAMIRITRNAYINTEMKNNDSDSDFSNLIKNKIATRINMPPVRLELSGSNEDLTAFLSKNLGIKAKQCFYIQNWFDYKFLFNLGKFLSPQKVENLKYEPFVPRTFAGVADSEKFGNSGKTTIIDSIIKKDLFLFYPYDTMDTFLKFMDSASIDQRVMAIKITIYRLDKQSRVVEALRRACRNGKDVTVVIELTARFDEENNLYFAEILKEAGCNVVYGVGNYKVHSKIALVVLSDKKEITYLTHIGTGNYNESTSKIYTDLNIITADPKIGIDAAEFFRSLSMGDVPNSCTELLVAPDILKKSFIEKIREQAELARNGKPSGIICKMNGLTDLDFVNEFMEASLAGVKIQLIVRGMCCLLPNVARKTENISVHSIVGRFLEHSRIYAFGADKKEIYISSADLMSRNTKRRVEIATPVKDESIKKKLLKILEIYLSARKGVRILKNNGKYERCKVTEPESCQEWFLGNSTNHASGW